RRWQPALQAVAAARPPFGPRSREAGSREILRVPPSFLLTRQSTNASLRCFGKLAITGSSNFRPSDRLNTIQNNSGGSASHAVRLDPVHSGPLLYPFFFNWESPIVPAGVNSRDQACRNSAR